jgi:hypothetical protein
MTLTRDVASLLNGMLVCDPQKIALEGYCSAVLADRAGSDEVSKLLDAARLADGPCRYVHQEGSNLSARMLPNAIADFALIGSEYFLNQFIEFDGHMFFWLPDFSEYSVCVFQPALYPDMRGTLEELGHELDDWISNDIWTDKERQFIVDGKARYTVLPLA